MRRDTGTSKKTKRDLVPSLMAVNGVPSSELRRISFKATK